MSYQGHGQFESKKLTFDDFTEIFRNNILMWVAAASLSASLSLAIHTFLLGSGSESDTKLIVAAMIYALAFVAQFLFIAKEDWSAICERQEVAFLVDRIKEKYDTTGITFKDRFQNYRQVAGIRFIPDGSGPIDVTFIFHPDASNEPLFVGSFANPAFYPTPLFGRTTY